MHHLPDQHPECEGRGEARDHPHDAASEEAKAVDALMEILELLRVPRDLVAELLITLAPAVGEVSDLTAHGSISATVPSEPSTSGSSPAKWAGL